MGMVWGRVSEPVSFAEIRPGCKPGNFSSARLLIRRRFYSTPDKKYLARAAADVIDKFKSMDALWRSARADEERMFYILFAIVTLRCARSASVARHF
jgi:hypothetical protein